MICTANTRFGTPCATLTSADSKWCPHHEELQGKCMRLYKQRSKEADAFSTSAVWNGWEGTGFPSVEAVQKCDEIETLREWHSSARRIWVLTNRTVLAREHHHSNFYRSGDNSHRHFITVLKNKQDVLELLMGTIDERLYSIMITADQASWLIPSNANSSESEFECHETSATIAPETPPASPVFRSARSCEEHEEVSAEVVLMRKREELQKGLLGYLEAPKLLPDATVQRERREIVCNIFRRTIAHDSGLLVRARQVAPQPQSPRPASETVCECSISDFITSPDLSLRELSRLWAKLKFEKHQIGPEMIRDAIVDVGRDCGEECCTGRIWVLGGWVWRKPLKVNLTVQQWNHFYAFVGCAGCMLLTCNSFTEWVQNRKLAIIGPRYPDWFNISDSTAENILRALDVVVCQHNSHIKVSKIEKIVPKGKGLRTVYTETQDRYFVYMRMPLDQPLTDTILSRLRARKTHFTILSRRGDTADATHPLAQPKTAGAHAYAQAIPPLSGNHVLSLPSMCFCESVFDTLRSPETGYKKRFEDALDVLVMDSQGGDFARFLSSIAGCVLNAAGYDSLESAVKGERENLGPGKLQTSYEDAALRAFRLMFREPVNEGGTTTGRSIIRRKERERNG